MIPRNGVPAAHLGPLRANHGRQRPNMHIADRYAAAIMPVQPMETQLDISHGDGPYLCTQDGDRYLDLATGIAVNSLGYGHPRVLEAIAVNSAVVDQLLTAGWRPHDVLLPGFAAH